MRRAEKLNTRANDQQAVRKWCVAKWRSSGISEEQARRLHLEPHTRAQAERLGLPGQHGAGPGFTIRYWDVRGQPTQYCRYRYAIPSDLMPGFTAGMEKPQKYTSPAGAVPEVYLPPLLPRGQTWADVLADPKQEIIITEGELKAACACLHFQDYPTLGLGGVDLYQSRKRGLDLLPVLADAEWKEREVFLVNDADAAQKPAVTAAFLRLAEELTWRGAQPRLATLPAGGPNGLDDFLMDRRNHGPAALQEHLDSAPTFATAAVLRQINSEAVLIEDPGIILVHHREDGTPRDPPLIISPDQFTRVHFADRTHTVGEGKNLKKVAAANSWMEWPQRAKLARQVYEPGADFPVAEVRGERCWNRWRDGGVKPRAGDVGPWAELLDAGFARDGAEARQWFEQWCAYPLQHPGAKLFTAVVLYNPDTGIGKSYVGETLIRIYGEANAGTIGQRQLFGDFNEWAVDRQFILGDEVSGSDSRREEDYLKELIAQTRITVNRKYLPTYTLRACINFLFTTNHPNGFFMQNTDRRFFIVEWGAPPAGDPFFKKRYTPWVDTVGPAHLAHHLLHLDLSGFDPHARAPWTRAKDEMIRAGKSVLGKWIMDLPEFLETRDSKQDIFTVGELRALYGSDPRRTDRELESIMGTELLVQRFARVESEGGEPRVKTRAGPRRLWIIRNREKWNRVTHRECVAHWEENRVAGAKEDKPGDKSKY